MIAVLLEVDVLQAPGVQSALSHSAHALLSTDESGSGDSGQEGNVEAEVDKGEWVDEKLEGHEDDESTIYSEDLLDPEDVIHPDDISTDEEPLEEPFPGENQAVLHTPPRKAFKVEMVPSSAC